MQFSPACERNKEPILAVLRRWLPTPLRVLEVGSGSGQHAVHFCHHIPGLHWQCSDRREHLPDLRERLEGEGRAQLASGSALPDPLELDVDDPLPWSQGTYGAVFSANTTHIMAAASVPRLLAGAASLLDPGGLLLLYGPFHRDGLATSPSNAAFDAHLRSLDPAMGVRDATTLLAQAAGLGLLLRAAQAMPAHNQLLILQRSAPPLPTNPPPPSPAAPPLPDWRLPLRQGLAALAPARRRVLRAYGSPTASAGLLEPLDSPTGSAPPLLDLASNDYLGLSRDPAVLAAAAAELAAGGLGAGASRLVSGTRAVHLALEAALAAWLGRERVLLFPSGFQANLAAVAALADRHSLVLADRLVHHSLLAGVRACGARLRRFAHNDPADLERLLVAARRPGGQGEPPPRLLVLCESLYSMEGSSAPVAALAALCAQHGAALLVDEAHALGVLGPCGRGLAHAHGGVALVSGTFGKAFGSGGAFLSGDALVGDWLLQSSGAFRYTTALAPPLAAGALAALGRIQHQPDTAAALLGRARRWRDGLEAAGWPRPPGEGPILSLPLGDDASALAAQERLAAAGLLALAIRPPTVPEGTARLRLVLRHGLPCGSLERLLAALGPPPPRPACP